MNRLARAHAHGRRDVKQLLKAAPSRTSLSSTGVFIGTPRRSDGVGALLVGDDEDDVGFGSHFDEPPEISLLSTVCSRVR